MIVSGLVSRTKALPYPPPTLHRFGHTLRNLERGRNQYGRGGGFRFLSVSKFILLVLRRVLRDRREFEGKRTALHLGTFARAAHYAWPRAF